MSGCFDGRKGKSVKTWGDLRDLRDLQIEEICWKWNCCLCFLFYRDDVLCWLLSCPFSSVCFPYLPPISGLIWFGSVYLVTTAGFVADQLIM